MSEKNDWWGTWAPFWGHMENQHFSTHVAEDLIGYIKSPVLVIGAGMGLIVEFLNQKGFDAAGIDLDRTMIKMAKKKRKINLLHADANNLPFENNQFNTVIISSGVVDYLDDAEQTTRIIYEAIRVLMSGGNLFVSFYQTAPAVEKIIKKIGIIKDKRYNIKRLFEISETVKTRPVQCVSKIVEWTGKKYFPTLLYWIKLGIFLPAEMKEYQRKTDLIFEESEKNGISRNTLINSVPDNVPYRDKQDIKKLLRQAGFYYTEMKRYPDCIIARYHKSSLLFSQHKFKKEKNHSKKNWIIKTEHLTKRYKKAADNAVDSLDIEIEKGTIHGILGPNGAGKTTTLSILCGLMKPDSGSIFFPDHIKKSEIKNSTGYVPQDLAIFTGLTAQENLNFFGRLYGIKGKQLKKKSHELLETVGLLERINDPVKKYSTGMMRRLNLAAGLMHDPEIIFLDEPTVGIDPQSRRCIFDAVLQLKETGVTVLYTTHYMEEAMKLCDFVSIMDHGKIILEGNPKWAVENFGLHHIEFKSKSNPDALVRKLEKDPAIFSAAVNNSSISIMTRPENEAVETINHIIESADKLGIELTLKHIHEPDLESLFLDITGKNLRD